MTYHYIFYSGSLQKFPYSIVTVNSVTFPVRSKRLGNNVRYLSYRILLDGFDVGYHISVISLLLEALNYSIEKICYSPELNSVDPETGIFTISV